MTTILREKYRDKTQEGREAARQERKRRARRQEWKRSQAQAQALRQPRGSKAEKKLVKALERKLLCLPEPTTLRWRLPRLGFKTYRQYLRSAHWQRMRARQPDRFCALCESTDSLNLHHQTYKRLGHEAVEDLAWLCRPCHTDLHARREGLRVDKPGGKTPAAEPQ